MPDGDHFPPRAIRSSVGELELLRHLNIKLLQLLLLLLSTERSAESNASASKDQDQTPRETRDELYVVVSQAANDGQLGEGQAVVIKFEEVLG